MIEKVIHAMVSDSVLACVLCPALCANRTQVVLSHGPPDSKILILGQAPGFIEDKVGKGFQGPSGKALRALLKYAKINMDECRVANVTKCMPPHNRRPTKTEIKNCTTTWLWDEITEQKPETIFAMGDVALQLLCPGEKISQIHGQKLTKNLTVLRSNGTSVVFKTTVIPMYHPAAAMYDHRLQPVLINDFKSLSAPPVAKEGWTLRPHQKLFDGDEAAITVDLETTTPDINGAFAPTLAEPIGIAFGVRHTDGVSAAYHATKTLEQYRGLLESENVVKIAHNAKFEYAVLARQGIILRNFHDTKLMAYVLGHTSTALKDLSGEVLGVRQMRYEEWDGISNDYPAGDAAYTLLLSEQLQARLEAEHLWDVYNDIDLPVVSVLAKMERAGVRIDLNILAGAGRRLADIRDKIGAEFPDYNLRKDADIRTLLYDVLHLPVLKRTQKAKLPSVEKEVLTRLAAQHEAAGKVLAWNEVDSLISKYTQALPKLVHSDGRIHGRFNQAGRYEDHDSNMAGTTTGRLSSSDPNLTNIPHRTLLGRLVREAFVPAPGYKFVRADISQEEPRIAAFLSRDKMMLERLDGAEDVYLPIAQTLYEIATRPADRSGGKITTADKRWRDPAKTIWLAKLYGAGGQKLQETAAAFGINITRMQGYALDKWFNSEYTEIAAFATRQYEFLREHGYVQTWFGRKRWIPKGISGNVRERAAAKREAANMPVQGTAADVLKLMLARVDNALDGHDARIVLTVHDEIVVEAATGEVPYVQEILMKSTENLLPIYLPVVVSKGDERWE